MISFKTFTINVASNDFRRNRILDQADKAGVDIQIFDAITPDIMANVHHTYTDKKSREFTGRPMMPTEIAAGLSHIQLWRQLQVDKDVDYYLILEDDIDVVYNIATILSSLGLTQGSHANQEDPVIKSQDDEIGFKIHLLKLSGQCKRPMKKIKDLSGGFTLHRYAFGPLDAAAYLVSKDGARMLERYCQTLHAPIDILMDRAYDHGVPIYGVLPYAASTQFNFEKGDPLFTDIGVRDRKYAEDITLFEKFMVKTHRLWGSLKRHLATARLHLVKE